MCYEEKNGNAYEWFVEVKRKWTQQASSKILQCQKGHWKSVEHWKSKKRTCVQN